jgi:iron complex transport system substrate-binding protein
MSLRTFVLPDERSLQHWDDLTRRGLLGGGLGLAALAGLAACGSDGPSAAPSAAPTERTVDTATGKVSVPADPARVVSIDYFTPIFCLELGLTPVGGIDFSWVDASSMYPDYIAPLKAMRNIGEITSTNFEQVVALTPDLILGPTPGSTYDNSKGALAKLDTVAPVATVDFGQTGDWRGPIAQCAEIIGRSDALEPLKAAYEKAIASAKATYADLIAGTTVTMIDYAGDGQFALDLPQSSSGLVLADLGMTFGAASADNGTNSVSLSYERLGDLADSDLILFRADAQGKPGGGLEEVFELDAWKRLPAVKAGHVYPAAWVDLCTYRWAELALTELTKIFDTYAA